MSYAPPSGSGLPFNLTGAYTPPTGNSVSADFGTLANVVYVSPQGVDTSSFGTASCGNVAATVAPAGTSSAQYGEATVANKARQVITQWTLENQFGSARASNVQIISDVGGINQSTFGTIYKIVLGYYTPPVGSAVNVLFVGGYIPPSGALPIDFANTYIASTVAPPGFIGATGTPTVANKSQTVALTGFNSSAYGTPTIVGLAFDGYGNIPPGGFGTAYLSRRFALEGFDSQTFGTTSLSPQYVRPQGWSGAIGNVTFDQTLTTRTVGPYSFSSAAVGAVKVDPRFVYTFGFRSTGDSARFGNLQIQLATLYPSAIPPGDFGVPRVDDGQQYASPAGIDAPDFPQPEVIGRWEYIYPSSVLEAGLFGDLSVKVVTRSIAPQGWADSQFPNYAPTVYNRTQRVQAFGFSTHAVADPPYDVARRYRVTRDVASNLRSTVLGPGDDVSAVGTDTRYLSNCFASIFVGNIQQSIPEQYQSRSDVASNSQYRVSFINEQTYSFAYGLLQSTTVVVEDFANNSVWTLPIRNGFANLVRLSECNGKFVAITDWGTNPTAPNDPTGRIVFRIDPVAQTLTEIYTPFTPGTPKGSSAAGDVLVLKETFNLRAISVTSLTQLWERTDLLSSDVADTATDGTSVFVVKTDGTLLRLNATTGSTVQTHAISSSGWLHSGPNLMSVVVASGRVLVLRNNDIRVFDATTLSDLASFCADEHVSFGTFDTFKAFGRYVAVGPVLVNHSSYDNLGYPTTDEISAASYRYVIDAQTLRWSLVPSAYTARTHVWNYAEQIAPTQTIGPETFGPETDAGLFVRYVAPQGLNAAGYGTATVANTAQRIDLATYGISGAFGATLVTPGVRIVEPSGRYFGEYGTEHVVEYSTRYLSNVGNIFAFSPATDTVVESSIRTVDHGTHGKDMSSVGAATVSFRVRAVEPPSIAYQFTWLQLGEQVRVEFSTKYLPLEGWKSGQFGTTTVARNEVIVTPPSIVGEAGQPTVEWGRRTVWAHTLGTVSEYGATQVVHNPRYVYQTVGDADAQYVGGVGSPLSVENRNKTVSAYGWRSSRFSSGNYVYNNARVLEAKGSDTSVFGAPFVADAVRYVTASGHDSSRVSYWVAAYNYTRIIEPTGIPRPYAGVPYVWSNTQYVNFTNAGNVFTQWGNQFVAYAVRTVSLDQQPGSLRRDGIPPPPFPATHYVGLFRQLAAPAGVPAGPMGDPVFEEKFSIVKPWGARTDVFGEPVVRNVTPELKPLPWIEFDMLPRHYVGLYTRYVGLTERGIAPPHQFLPTPNVDFRTKTIRVIPGINSLRIPLLHDVRLDVPQIPATQLVEVPSVPDQPGNPPDAAAYGRPTVAGQPLVIGWVSSRFGDASVRVQGCSPLWDWPSSTFGTPTLNPARFINVLPGIPSEVHGKPRMSPHTVYCTSDAPMQYKDNHGPKQWILIDGDGPALGRQEPAEDVQWGTAYLSLKSNRVVAHFHRNGDPVNPDFTIGELFGETDVANKIRTIYPEGVEPDLMGIPDLPTSLEIFVYPFVASRYGEATVALGPPPPTTQTVAPPTVVAIQFGTTFVELFNRTIVPTGSRMDVFGNNEPMVYFPRGPEGVGALDASGWGNNRVEYKDRVIYPQGHDSFTMDYDIMSFNDRLRIYKKNHPFYPAGQSHTMFGTTGVRLKAQIISPYQIAAPSCLGHDVYVLEEA